MDYRRFDNVIYAKFKQGEEILEDLKEICEKEDIRLASVQGLGACSKAVVGVYDVAGQEYHSCDIEGMLELVSLTGNVTRDDSNEVYLHCHAMFAQLQDDGTIKCSGGHLNSAVISATGEIVITVSDGSVGRVYSPQVGLNLWKFRPFIDCNC
ncbi:MAG: DNA-binding protein [Eubacteriaceae bacterium]|jgi:predicted DNA-binding protein with PD1-like motif|nr:DNA-binding protein [Eubacteriaceae bacterium]